MATRKCWASSVLKGIAKEMQALQQSPPEDIQVEANDEDLSEIQAWIRGPAGTPYENGYFKVRIALSDEFPATPPKGHFITKIFHPNVSPTGEICVNTIKKDWKAELGISHVLLSIKCLLIVPNPESALNEEAGRLLLEQYDDYARRARLYTSIHAKSGMSEFERLVSERPKKDPKPETTENATEVDATATTPKNDDTKSANPPSVLTPSAVNNAAEPQSVSTKLKRTNDKASHDHEVNASSKRGRITATKDKKKGLRRL